MTDRELMQQALEAAEVLEKLFRQAEAMYAGTIPAINIDCQITVADLSKGLYAAAAIREALAEQPDTKVSLDAIPKQMSEPAQEPVRWLDEQTGDVSRVARVGWTPLYTAPQPAQQPEQEPVANEKFTRAWLRLDELPGTMMQGPEGLFGPIPGSTSTWVTTSERERDHQISNGNPMLEVYTSPPANKPLTEYQKWRMYEAGPDMPSTAAGVYMRAVDDTEAAHGITGEKK